MTTVPCDTDATRLADFHTRVRNLLTRADVEEIDLVHPFADPTDITLLDLRATPTEETWARARNADVCVIDLSSSSADRELATDAAALAPHVFALTTEPTDTVRRALGLDPGRLVCLRTLDPASLAARVLDERALTAGVRAIAALRLAQTGIEAAITADEARDREAIERLSSYRLPEGGQRLDQTRRHVAGAIAGRAIRILQGALGALDGELASIREQRLAAVSAAISLDALRAEVAAAAAPLAELRPKLATHAQALVHEALSQLGPGLMEDLDRRVATVLEEIPNATPRPTWPAAPRVHVPEDALVARESLAQGEQLRAEIGWTDSVLRSLEKVKQRVTQQLAQDLDQIAQRARAEVMRAEPLVAKSLRETLESWIGTAGDTYTTWLDSAIATATTARARARTTRQAPFVSARTTLTTQIQRLTTLTRTLGARPTPAPATTG